MTGAQVLFLTAVGLSILAAPGLAAAPDPFGALGLVRFESGIKVPDFTLPGLNSSPVSVSSPPDSAALLVFWATW